MSEPRFIVTENYGYPINLGNHKSAGRGYLEVMVLDRAWNHKVVWSSLNDRKPTGQTRLKHRQRRRAGAVCDFLNDDDAAGRTPIVPKLHWHAVGVSGWYERG